MGDGVERHHNPHYSIRKTNRPLERIWLALDPVNPAKTTFQSKAIRNGRHLALRTKSSSADPKVARWVTSLAQLVQGNLQLCFN